MIANRAVPAKRGLAFFNSAEFSLVVIILLLGVILAKFGGTHPDRTSGLPVSNFLNANTLLELATNSAFFAIMAVGATGVIVSAGIDLSVGSLYALSAVCMAMVLRAMDRAHMTNGAELIIVGIVVSVGVGVLGGLLNGIAVVLLDVHPFIITLGALWVYRGIAFVTTKAVSIRAPDAVINFTKASLGFKGDLHPVPLIVMILVGIAGAIYLSKTPYGRRIFAVGGNLEASRYAGLPVKPIICGVYVLAGLCAGISAFLGTSYYGAASCADANGYELYVIASAVVGGASLSGGKGTAYGAVLGTILIEMIRESITILHLDSNYEQIIVGLAIVVAVVLDRNGAKLREKRMARMRVEARESQTGAPTGTPA